MKPARPVNLFDLPPDKRRELADAIDRHPARNRQSGAGSAVPAAPPARSGKSERWRCHQCGHGFRAWAPAQRHSHGWATRIELVLK